MRTTGNEFFYMDESNQCFKRTRARDITRRNVNPLFETLRPIYFNVSIRRIFFLICVRYLAHIYYCISVYVLNTSCFPIRLNETVFKQQQWKISTICTCAQRTHILMLTF